MILTLTEHEPKRLTPDQLPPHLGEQLWRRFDQQGGRIRVAFPSPQTGHMWELTPQSWVGTIPLTPDFHLHIQPKVPLHNLFQMLRWHYGWEVMDGLTAVTAVSDLWSALAERLAMQVLRRVRLGLHRAYQPRHAHLPYVRGRMAVAPAANPTTIACDYRHHTSDLPHNQVLAYTLGVIARSRICQPDVQQVISRAYRAVAPALTPRPFTGQACATLPYNRLNDDYRPMHALCRFFLDHLGPSHQHGDREMTPFLVEMNRLFERFVAAWLHAHTPAPWHFQAQERVTLGSDGDVRLSIDLVLYDGSGQVAAVLDTKYKTPDQIDTADLSQVVTYAKARQAPAAILLYPQAPKRPLRLTIGGDLLLRTLSFPLDGDLDAAGRALLAAILP